MNPIPIFISGMVAGFILTTLGAETRAFEVSQAHAAEVEELREQQLMLPPDFAEKVRLMQLLAEPILTRASGEMPQAARAPVATQDDVGALIAPLEN